MTTNPKITDKELSQVAIRLSRQPADQELAPLSVVATLAAGVEHDDVKGWEAVYRRAITDSGLFESEIADALGMDKGNFSKAISSGAMQQRRISAFCKAVGNRIVVQVSGYLESCELRPLETELERENRELREQLQELKKQRDIEISLIRDLKH